MHESAHAGELSRVTDLPLEAVTKVMHRDRDDHGHRRPPEKAAEVRCGTALHSHTDHRQADHGGTDDDRRVGAGVIQRHGEDRQEDQG